MKLLENVGRAGKFGGLGMLGIDAATLAFNGAAFGNPLSLGLLGTDLAIAGLGWGLEKYEQKRDAQPA